MGSDKDCVGCFFCCMPFFGMLLWPTLKLTGAKEEMMDGADVVSTVCTVIVFGQFLFMLFVLRQMIQETNKTWGDLMDLV